MNEQPAPGQNGWPPHPAVEEVSWHVPNRAEKRGYQRKRKRFTLRFDDHPTLSGLEVVARSVSFGRLLELQEFVNAFDEAADAGAAKRAAHVLVEEFAMVVESWNYRDEDDREVPFTAAFLLSEFDPDEAMQIMRAWMRATQGVTDPLPQTSADGQLSAEVQIPMDVPSQSRAS